MEFTTFLWRFHYFTSEEVQKLLGEVVCSGLSVFPLFHFRRSSKDGWYEIFEQQKDGFPLFHFRRSSKVFWAIRIGLGNLWFPLFHFRRSSKAVYYNIIGVGEQVSIISLQKKFKSGLRQIPVMVCIPTVSIISLQKKFKRILCCRYCLPTGGFHYFTSEEVQKPDQ